MTQAERAPGRRGDDRTAPCGALAGPGQRPAVFVRVADRLAQLVRISTGQAAERSFDALLCPPPAGGVTTWRPPVARGRWIAFAFYGPRAFEPLLSLYAARLDDPAALPAPAQVPQPGVSARLRVNDAESARAFLAETGLPDIRVYAEQLGYHLGSAREWWDILSNGLRDTAAAALPAERRSRLEAEHLDEVTALVERGPVWVEVPVIFALGRRPAG